MEKYLYNVEFDSLSIFQEVEKNSIIFSDYCQQSSKRHECTIFYDEGSLISGVQLNEQA
jgi:hypothetical protein